MNAEQLNSLVGFFYMRNEATHVIIMISRRGNIAMYEPFYFGCSQC
jgi:hypothetical protein